MYGWRGTILNVDLTKRKIWKEPLSDDDGKNLLGGRGINAKLLWDLIGKPGIDALDPRNPLIFGIGPLAGTVAPCSGRTTVTCKGAETNLYLRTSMGGAWGGELKFAGYDHVVIHGASESPAYLWINDENVELRDAAYLWGMDVEETDKTLKKDLGDREIRVACIGPAGENLVRISAIMNSLYSAAARGGIGAVMGSKKLKAIAVRGTRGFEVKDPDKLRDIAYSATVALAEDKGAQSLHEYGTSGLVEAVNALGAFPAYNFKEGYSENIRPLTGQALVEDGYLTRIVGCFGCAISCHRHSEIGKGRFAGAYTGGPEYETFGALGAGTGVYDTETVIQANRICNMLGMDTISAGSVVQWAMESYERGVLTKDDTDGIELKFGNGDALIQLLEMIGRRKGKIGNLLAEGVKRASERVGKDSWKWALVNSKGLEQSRVETRSAKSYALAFAVNPRGPDHLHTETMAEFGTSPEAIALIEELTGDKKWASPYFTEYRPEIVRWHEDCYAITDALGFCAFATTLAYGVNPKNMAEMFSAATGIEIDEKGIMLAGRRIVTLEKCFNVREGADRKLDDLPYRLMHEPSPSGPGKGLVNSREELDGMLDKYYELHEWDLKTSWPYRRTLDKLNLSYVADNLEKWVKLPK